MLPTIIQTLLTRELQALRRNVELYPDDDSLWTTPPGITNSGGTLVLHLAGNLQSYLGASLGGTGYVRDRPAEFSRRGLSRRELVAEIDASILAVERGAAALTPESLWARYPEDVAGRAFSTGDFLFHLVAHLGYHLGQVDYHRRLVTGDNRGADAVPLLAIPAFDAAR